MLFAHSFGIQIGIRASQNLGQKCEEVELNRKPILARGHQISLYRSKRAFVGMPILIAEFVPSCPPAGANHIQTSVMDLAEILVPDICIGIFKKKALNLTRHVGRSNYRDRIAIQF